MNQRSYFQIKKALIIGLFIIIHFGVTSFAQDSLKTVSISYNLIQGCINEQSIYVEYSPFRHHKFGISIGKIYDNNAFEVFVLSPSQNTFPGTVYRGNVYRLSYSYIFNKKSKSDYYIGAQYIYRDMYYNHKQFRDGGDSHVEYSRNEKATVIGFDLISGLNKYKKLNKNFSLLFNVYYGIGWRERYRTIYTYNLHYYGGGGGVNSPPQLGNETKIQQYWIPVFGIKLGLQFHI